MIWSTDAKVIVNCDLTLRRSRDGLGASRWQCFLSIAGSDQAPGYFSFTKALVIPGGKGCGGGGGGGGRKKERTTSTKEKRNKNKDKSPVHVHQRPGATLNPTCISVSPLSILGNKEGRTKEKTS